MANRKGSEPAARRGTARKQQTPVKRTRTKAPVKGAAPGATKAAAITAEERYQLIAETAYLIAEKRGFGAGRELDDWLEAEVIIAARRQDKTA